MPAAPMKSIRHALETGTFDPVYYFHGDDDHLKDEAVRRLIERAIDPATRDFNLEQRYAADVDPETLGTMLDTLPMMAARRVVTLRDVGAMRKDVRTVLDRYLKHPGPDTVVVLVSPAGAKAEKTLLDRATAIEFRPLTDKQLPAWIARHAQETLGVAISPAASAVLQSVVGPDLPQLASELEKLASYVEGAGDSREIDEAAVAAVVGVRHGETMGDLLDRIGERDARGALALLPHVLMQPRTSAVVIVMALATQMLALSWARAALDEGLSRSRLFGQMMDLLKQGGSVFTGRPWGEAVGAWMRHVERWTPAGLDRALDLLLDADIALKETRVSSDEQLLATLTLALCADDARTAAA
jgi:DNA polymerase-3 subunit delta